MGNGSTENWSVVGFREMFIEDAARTLAHNINKNWYVNEDTGKIDKEALQESIAYELSSDFYWNEVALKVDNACIYPSRCKTILKRIGGAYKNWEDKLLNDDTALSSDLFESIDSVEKAAAQALYDFFGENQRTFCDKIQRKAYRFIMGYDELY